MEVKYTEKVHMETHVCMKKLITKPQNWAVISIYETFSPFFILHLFSESIFGSYSKVNARIYSELEIKLLGECLKDEEKIR